jgi:polyisoprenoid-binding protein YceI
MRGVSKEVAIPFTITDIIKDPQGNQRFGVEAALTLNRQGYGVSYKSTLSTGELVVGDEVKIELNLEAVKRKAEPPR